MKKAYWIFIKEWNSFLGANLPPTVIGIMALMSGLVSVLMALSEGATNDDIVRAIFYYFYILMILSGLLLSMSSFVNEKRQGTMELLYTLPVTDLELVMGKFMMGAAVLSALATALSVVYVLIIAGASYPVFFTGLIGLILVGFYAFAAGTLSSAIFSNNLTSLLFGVLIVMLIDVGGYLAGLLPGSAREIFSYFHGLNHFTPFTRGVLTYKSIVFFISLISVFLFFTVKVLESRRWRGQA
jgi:ABC-2 type transport system permease protein